jgi:hypothetical protein
LKEPERFDAMLYTILMTKRTLSLRAHLRNWHLLLLSLILLITMAACASQSKESLQQAIVGKWINAQNYSIEFYADGTGFVPAVEGDVPVPATNFSYSVTDGTHINITMGEIRGMNVEVKIEGNQMTWQDQNAGISFVYTRGK